MADIDDVKELILWSRDRGVVLHRVRVGAVELDIASMQQGRPTPTEDEARKGLYATMGGEVVQKILDEDEAYTEDD